MFLFQLALIRWNDWLVNFLEFQLAIWIYEWIPLCCYVSCCVLGSADVDNRKEDHLTLKPERVHNLFWSKSLSLYNVIPLEKNGCFGNGINNDWKAKLKHFITAVDSKISKIYTYYRFWLWFTLYELITCTFSLF